MTEHDETPTERRMRLGRELSELLADELIGVASDGRFSALFEPLDLEAGRALGLADEDVAYIHLPTGEVWTVEVEVSCQLVTRPEGTS